MSSARSVGVLVLPVEVVVLSGALNEVVEVGGSSSVDKTLLDPPREHVVECSGERGIVVSSEGRPAVELGDPVANMGIRRHSEVLEFRLGGGLDVGVALPVIEGFDE